MLAHGAPEDDENRPKTWTELIVFPLILALLFVLTLHLFLKYVPPSKQKFVLPIHRRHNAGGIPLANERQRRQQQHGEGRNIQHEEF